MKQIPYMILQLLLILIVFNSCEKDKVQENKESSEYFPNKIGNYWEYEVYDSSEIVNPAYPNPYKVEVRITGVKQLVDGKDAMVWEYTYPWGIDKNYIRIVSDTIKIFDTVYSITISNLQFPRKMFLLPFQDGKVWDGKLLASDKYSVSSDASVSTKWTEFHDCFKVYNHYYGPNMEYKDSYWFKPKIGLIMLHKHQYNLAPLTKELWQLKRYFLN